MNLEFFLATKLLGVWVTDDLSWSRNTRDICTKVFSRVGMITKLKYVGVGMEDLIDIFKLFIRSVSEYCSVLFHSRLTVEDSAKLEIIQKIRLNPITRGVSGQRCHAGGGLIQPGSWKTLENTPRS